MDIKVINTINKKELIIEKFDINETLKTLKKEIIKMFNISLSYSRIGLSYKPEESSKEKKSMADDSRKLLDYENFSNKSIIFVKDLGPQFSYKGVYVIEYLGPLIIYIIYFIKLFNQRDGKYEKTQLICLILSTFHYLKRIFESLFIHIFSRSTMPLSNLIKNCAYYWGYYGIFCGYFLFNVNYHEREFLKPLRYFFVLFFVSAELKNLKCHIILRNLRLKNKGQIGIPDGEGFELVTCANYFWEILSWFCFSIISFHWAYVLFMFMGYYQMKIWAKKKHERMLKMFGDKYPKDRKMIIPYWV